MNVEQMIARGRQVLVLERDVIAVAADRLRALPGVRDSFTGTPVPR